MASAAARGTPGSREAPHPAGPTVGSGPTAPDEVLTGGRAFRDDLDETGEVALVDGRFELLGLVGSGGHGSVYRARDHETGRDVALKLPSRTLPELALRFTREAELLRDLVHPGIVHYIAHGETGRGRPFLAMEWLEGETLGERLLREGRLEVKDAIALVARVAEALAVAHRRGVVHRDIKPSNIFLPDRDLARPKLLDFGVARSAGAEHELTRTGAMLGTPGYIAPEQARGQRVDARADVFALGCVLFKCLTGRRAFGGNDTLSVLLKIVLDEALQPGELRSGVPPMLDDLTSRMLAKSPKDRPAHAGVVAEALDAMAGAAPGSESISARSGLTDSEAKITCIILVRTTEPSWHDESPPLSPSISADSEAETCREGRARRAGLLPHAERAVAEVSARHGGRLDLLADGSLLVTFTSHGSAPGLEHERGEIAAEAANDQVARAARCALEMRRVVGELPMSLCAGRSVAPGRLPLGDVIERGVALLSAVAGDGSAPSVRGALPPLRLDEVSAGLLDARFEVSGDARSLTLRGERGLLEPPRTLLGKPTRCVGRDRDLVVLQAFFDECVEEPRARPVLVTGPPGVGKSRLRYEFLRSAQREGAEVWIGRGDPMSAGSPFAMLAQAIRRALGLVEGEPSSVRHDKVRARVGRHLSGAVLERVAAFLGELVGAPADVEAAERNPELCAARHDPVLKGDQMMSAWIEWLRAECATAPVILVLEDLHWGDVPTIKFVDAALRSLHDAPFLVLALARPEVHDLFGTLWAERGVQEVRLGELTRKGSELLVREALGDHASGETVARLVEHAGGNAFYLEELIRLEAEGRRESLPESVLAMVQLRLEALEPEARQVLRAGSVFGDLFWGGGVSALLGADRSASRVGEWLALLVEREVITRRGPGQLHGEVEYAFRHALLREAAYATLTVTDRALGHRLAGEWLEKVGERDALLLAEHFERGGDAPRSISYYARASAQALEGNDLDAAIERADRGIQNGAQGATLGELYLRQAEAHGWRGEHVHAEARALAAMESLPRHGDAYHTALGRAIFAAERLRNRPRLDALVADLLEAPDDGASGAYLMTLAQAAGSLGFSDQGAAPVYRRLDALAPTIARRDARVRAWVHRAYAVLAAVEGDVGEHLRLAEEAVACFERAGDLRCACGQRSNFADASIRIGAYAQAERAMRAALEAAERMGLHDVATIARTNLGLALARRGAVSEGRAVLLDAVRSASARGDRRVEGCARSYLAIVLQIAGQLDAAEIEARAAVETLSGMPGLSAPALATLAEVVLASGGDPEEALSIGRSAMTMLEASSMAESAVRLAHARALSAAGFAAEARDAIVVARARLLARAGRITDPAHRASFLERVPENAETLAMAAAP